MIQQEHCKACTHQEGGVDIGTVVNDVSNSQGHIAKEAEGVENSSPKLQAPPVEAKPPVPEHRPRGLGPMGAIQGVSKSGEKQTMLCILYDRTGKVLVDQELLCN